jgi:hypothetical protein
MLPGAGRGTVKGAGAAATKQQGVTGGASSPARKARHRKLWDRARGLCLLARWPCSGAREGGRRWRGGDGCARWLSALGVVRSDGRRRA